MISQESIDKILLKSDIVEVINNFINLNKIGCNYRGLSPFSNESTPSLMVSPLKKIWKDFSSGKGGNVITFLMEYKNISYPESLIWLAKKYNIEITEINKRYNSHFSYEKNLIFEIQEFAKNFFIENLKYKNNLGKNYLIKRLINDNVIKKFEIGYANNNWNDFINYALKKKYKLELIKNAGLSITINNKYLDRFRNSIIFPIKNIKGKILGFGSRYINEFNNYKYLNSPESIIYKKRKTLYGIYESKKYILKEDFCYLVEGYIDVISLHQINIKNVIATLGTSITNDQIFLIKKLTKNVILLYDGDQAGINASIKTIDLMLKNSINIKILMLNNGDDPDSFIKKNKKLDFKKFVYKNSKNFVEFKIKILLGNSVNNIQKKKFLINNILKSISIIPNNIDKELYIQETARLINININILYNELKKIKYKEDIIHINKNLYKKKISNNENINNNVDPLLIAEKMIIKFILLYANRPITINTKSQGFYKTTVAKEILDQFKINNFNFSFLLYQKIFNNIKNIYESKKYINKNYIIEILKNNTSFLKNIKDDNYSLANWKLKKIDVISKEAKLVEHLNEILLRYKSHFLSKIINNLIIRYKENNNNKIMDKIIRLTNIKIEINKKLHRYV